MCELNAFILEGNHKKTVMEDVVRLIVDGDNVIVTGMLGDTLTVKGKILRVDITKQEAIIT